MNIYARRTNAVFITTPLIGMLVPYGFSPEMPRERLQVPFEKLKVLRPGDSTIVGGVKITAWWSSHPSLHYTATYLVETEDSIKIYFANDSEPFALMREIADKGIDICLCPVNWGGYAKKIMGSRTANRSLGGKVDS